MIINNKVKFYELWMRGLLGNRPRMWPNAKALADDSYKGSVTARSLARSFASLYRVPKEEAIKLSGYIFNESPPDELLVIQGEAQRGPRGLELTYTYDKLPMKRCTFQYAHGLQAEFMIDDDVKELLEEYDDHVVEFSTYSVRLGTCSRYTLIWEVRRY